MAKFTPGAIISELSGSIAAVTYSRNRGGAYSKPRMTQNNPNSAAQVAVRALTAAAVAAWQALSPAVQESWKQFATTQNSSPTLGQSSKLSGYTAFMRFYIVRNMYGLTGDPVPKIQEPFVNTSEFMFYLESDSIALEFYSENMNSEVYAVCYLSDAVSAGRTTIPESKAVIMYFEELYSGLYYIDLTSFWVARFGSIAAQAAKKIFARIELVNRLTAQSLVVWRGSEIVPTPFLAFSMGVDSGLLVIASSRDLINFIYTPQTLPGGNAVMAWSPALGVWSIISTDNSSQSTGISADGISFTDNDWPTALGWTKLVWAPALNVFAALTPADAANQISLSSDGENYTRYDIGVNDYYVDLTWSETLGMFIACPQQNAFFPLVTSPDGMSWSNLITPANLLIDQLQWCAGLNMFVGLAMRFGIPQGVYSADGSSWGFSAIAADGYQFGIAYNSATNRVIAIGFVSGDYVIMYSDDGMTWSVATLPAGFQIDNITYSASLGKFFAIGYDGSNYVFMYSVDGLTWTSATGTADYNSYTLAAR